MICLRVLYLESEINLFWIISDRDQEINKEDNKYLATVLALAVLVQDFENLHFNFYLFCSNISRKRRLLDFASKKY